MAIALRLAGRWGMTFARRPSYCLYKASRCMVRACSGDFADLRGCMSWKADSLHFVAFGDIASAVDSLQPWLRVFGNSPQQLQNAPTGQQPFSTASGSVGAYQFAINSNPGRVELVLGPGQSSSGSPEPIADWKSALQLLVSHAVAASENMNSNRVAIVGNFSQKTANAEQAGQIFKTQIGVKDVPERAVDLSFGFNIKKDLNDIANGMNRLCRWGTGVQKIFGMQINSTGGAPTISIQEDHVAILQIDINTAIMDFHDNDLRNSIVQQLAFEVTSIVEGGYAYFIS